MKYLNKKIISLLLVIAVILTATSIPVVSAVTKNLEDSSASVETQVSANSYGLADDVQQGQILQCWNWSYNGIKNNMKKIAEQGFTAVQTSPIQGIKESTKGKSMKGSWWVYYQPINFNIDTSSQNAFGTKAEFKAMCDEAHKYGVKVIVDAVLNHMANKYGNDLSDLIIPDIKNDSSCWYSIKTNTSNWNDRYDITHNCMDGLPDLNTSNTKIQNYATSFLKECIDNGVDGFRFDGAKHIEVPADRSGVASQFWPNVLNATTSYAKSTRGITPYYYGEVLDETGGVAITGYTQYMSVTDNGLSNDIRNKVNSRNASGAANAYIGKNAAANKAVQWNESHDTYANGSSMNISTTVLNKTWAIVGSRADVCGMYFARPNDFNAQIGTASVTAWGNKEVQAVNQFKNYFAGQSEYLTYSGSIAYNERGTTGVVLVNCNGESQNVSVPAHKMQAGTYKDVITGNTFTVSGGKISGQIGSTGIAVVYSGVKQPANTISQAGGNFKTDTLTLTLGLENATSGTYQIGSDSAKTYTGTTTITIGAGVAYGSTITVKLTATGEGGTTSATYTFKKVDPNAVRIIDFSNDHTVYLWNTAKWSTQYCYSWPTGGDGAVPWPGSTMTKVDTFGGYDLYKFTIPASDSNIIFHNNTGDSGKTADLTLPTEMMVFDNGKNTWVDANSIDDDVLASRGGETSTPQSSTGSGKTYLYGDVDLSGAINVKDATLVQKVAANISTINTIQSKAANVNGDAFIDVRDATLIQKYAANIVNSFTVGSSFTDGNSDVTSSKPTTSSTTLPPSTVTITIKDNTPEGWLGDADALFILVDTSTNKEYQMSKTGDVWQASVPASVKNIKFNRNNPNNTSETWNSWDAGNRGSSTTYVATSSGVGSWS
ncbi:MAG: starch-binding protein [Oscillospiraceae bacterium]|nr:starch-binding protein [Oscillospiraceae bacterium]